MSLAAPRSLLVVLLLSVLSVPAALGCRETPITPEPAPDEPAIGGAPRARRPQAVDPCGSGRGRLCPGEMLGDRVLAIARDHARGDRLEVEARWAPMPCAPTWQPAPGDMYRGEPSDSAHARTLDHLFAGDAEDDRRSDRDRPVPRGQTVVKEAWTAVEEPGWPLRASLPPGRAREGERVYRTGERAGLFRPPSRTTARSA